MERASLPTGAGFVVLFDIDGTLLSGPERGPSAGFLAMSEAIREVSGRDGVYRAVEFAGRTDVQIARALLVATGEPDPPDERVGRIVGRYVDRLRENVRLAPYTVIGSPREVIARLRGAGGIAALGTGNVRAGGAIKLESAGIGDLFDMGLGGFGDDGPTRADVLRAGVGRCDPSGALPVVIVGDTPHDVSAAHEIGARCIGVPYRQNDAAALARAGADLVVRTIDGELVAGVARLLGAR